MAVVAVDTADVEASDVGSATTGAVPSAVTCSAPSSRLASRAVPPASTATATAAAPTVTGHRGRRTARARPVDRGKPSSSSASAVGSPAGWVSTRSRRPIGSAKAGATAISAGSAARALVRSQVSQCSTWRATRLRTSTEKVPSQPWRIAASSAQSRRPVRATTSAPSARLTRSRIRKTRV